ncbi:MAG: response regulator [Anaerolineaceae bacterium]|nr:MAG: response regulator [Anaerolineaceae bacterium]
MSVEKKRKHILVVDNDQAAAYLVRGLLEAQGYEAIIASTGEEGYEQAIRFLPDLIITDVVLPGMDGYAMCRMLRQRPATRSLPILMLSQKGDLESKIKGFDTGVDDYLTKPFAPEELRYRVRSLLTRSAPQPQSPTNTRGRIIAFFGAKGGVGKTTLSVNTALALQQTSKSRVALMDTDYYFGNVGVQLNITSRHSILELCDTPVAEIDKEMMDAAMISTKTGLRLLLAPLLPEDAERVTKKLVEHMLKLLAESYDFVVVDCPPNYDDRTLEILEGADIVIMVLTPEIGAFKNASMFFGLSEKINLPTEDVFLLLNRADSEVGIDAHAIEKALKRKVGFSIMSGGRAVVLSVNRGTPMILDQPNHPFSKQIQQLANALIKHKAA